MDDFQRVSRCWSPMRGIRYEYSTPLFIILRATNGAFHRETTGEMRKLYSQNVGSPSYCERKTRVLPLPHSPYGAPPLSSMLRNSSSNAPLRSVHRDLRVRMRQVEDRRLRRGERAMIWTEHGSLKERAGGER